MQESLLRTLEKGSVNGSVCGSQRNPFDAFTHAGAEISTPAVLNCHCSEVRLESVAYCLPLLLLKVPLIDNRHGSPWLYGHPPDILWQGRLAALCS